MIENMRKYTGLMAVVFVLLGAGFLFTMNSFNSRGGGGGADTVLSVGNHSLNQSEYRRMSHQTLELCDMLGLSTYSNLLLVPDHRQMQQSFRFGGYSYHRLMGRNIKQGDYNRFVANRIILQNAMEEFGIYASDEEVFKAVQELPLFVGQDGKFSKSAYDTFLEKGIGKLGLTQNDMLEVVRESLCLTKLVQIVGGGLLPPRTAARDSVEAQNQIITLAKVVLDRDDFVKKQKPTEAEIKAHWDVTQDKYKTAERRRISYVLLDLPAEKEETPVTPPAGETPEAKKAREEAEAKARDAKELKLKEAGKKLTARATKISDTVYKYHNSKKKLDLPEIVADNKEQLHKTELFDLENPPAAFKDLKLRSLSDRDLPVAQHIFRLANSSDPYDRLSDALPVGKHGWMLYYLEEVEAPDLLKYEQAKEKARKDLIQVNADKALKKAIEDGRKAVIELMAAGKDFDTAAREKGFTTVQVGPFSMQGTPPKDEPSYRQFFYKATGMNPGDVSEIITEKDRSLFFWVEKRQLEESEDNIRRINNEIDGGKSDLMIRAYMNWLAQQLEKNPLSGPATKAE